MEQAGVVMGKQEVENMKMTKETSTSMLRARRRKRLHQCYEQCHQRTNKRNSEVQESETEVVWTREETRPRIRRKKDSGDDTTWEKKKKTKTEARIRWMDCANRDMRAIGTTSDEVHERTGWRRIVSAAATPSPSGSG